MRFWREVNKDNWLFSRDFSKLTEPHYQPMFCRYGLLFRFIYKTLSSNIHIPCSATNSL